MGIVRFIPPSEPNPFCICIPPMWWAVGVGTIWKCDACGRVWERVNEADGKKWVRR